MFNSCSFTGRLAGEPKLFEKDGVLRAVFTLAVDRDKRGEDGEYETDFLDFVAWRDSADFVRRCVHSGDMITVAGARAQVRKHEMDGQRRYKVEFVADQIYFNQSKRDKAEKE